MVKSVLLSAFRSPFERVQESNVFEMASCPSVDLGFLCSSSATST